MSDDARAAPVIPLLRRAYEAVVKSRQGAPKRPIPERQAAATAEYLECMFRWATATPRGSDTSAMTERSSVLADLTIERVLPNQLWVVRRTNGEGDVVAMSRVAVPSYRPGRVIHSMMRGL